MTICAVPSEQQRDPNFPDPQSDIDAGTATEASLILGGGCFWCTEAVFLQLSGVTAVESGYAGGDEATANYKAVCSGTTDHAEVIRIDYNPQKISYGQILKVFFSVAHDPTHKDRQGNDRGRQYRSVIFYESADQQQVAAEYIRQLDKAEAYSNPIATTLEPLENYFAAEGYHQNYAALNPNQPYIAGVSAPKVKKLKQKHKDMLKS